MICALIIVFVVHLKCISSVNLFIHSFLFKNSCPMQLKQSEIEQVKIH